MNDNVEVDGEVDVSWSSYWDGDIAEMHQQTDESNKHDGTMKTETIPSEIANPDELTDKQRKVITLATNNPNLTASAIDDKIGSEQYASKILRQKCPNWYEEVFKQKSKKTKSSTTANDSTNDSEQEFNPVSVACETVIATSENQELVNFAIYIQSLV